MKKFGDPKIEFLFQKPGIWSAGKNNPSGWGKKAPFFGGGK